MCCASLDDDQEGVMDNLLEALKNGSAFNVNRDRKDARKRQPRAAGGKLSCILLCALLSLPCLTVVESESFVECWTHVKPKIVTSSPDSRNIRCSTKRIQVIMLLSLLNRMPNHSKHNQ
jgi:hypothetical protein